MPSAVFRFAPPIDPPAMKRRLQALLVLSALLLAALAMAKAPRRPATTAPDPGAAEAMNTVAMPWLRVEFVAPVAELHGQLPDEAEHRAIMRRAGVLYGQANVIDRVRVGGVANPAWLSPASLPDLRHAARATVMLADAQLSIEGYARNAAARAHVSASLASYADSGVTVHNRLRVADERAASEASGP